MGSSACPLFLLLKFKNISLIKCMFRIMYFRYNSIKEMVCLQKSDVFDGLNVYKSEW